MKTDDRLSRLLLLVPYFLARPGMPLAEAAADLGVSEAQLRGDLQLLFMCGLPGYGPGDLIDMSIVDDAVTITYDAGISRPLRLTADEAMALIVALRALADVPGLAARDVVLGALAVLEHAAGERGAGAARVSVATRVNEDTMSTVSGALDRRRALRLRYYTAGRDVISDRTIDPIRLLLIDGTAYLQAWCRSAEAVRTFRLDRIEEITELAEPARPVETPPAAELSAGVFTPPNDAVSLKLRIGPASRWISEYYPCEEVYPDGPSRWIVRLRATDLAWARRLVMGCDADVEVLQPAELAADIRAHAAAALANYAA